MNYGSEIHISNSAPMTTAHEIINFLQQREEVAGIWKEHDIDGLNKSDALYKLSSVTLDPIARALFRKWYHESTKDEIASLRMCAKLVATIEYGAAGMFESLRGGALERLCEDWIKPAKNNRDYFTGYTLEDSTSHLWRRDTFVSAYGSRGRIPADAGLLSNTIRFMLLYGNKLCLSNYIFDIPFHVRSMMIRRNMIRK